MKNRTAVEYLYLESHSATPVSSWYLVEHGEIAMDEIVPYCKDNGPYVPQDPAHRGD